MAGMVFSFEFLVGGRYGRRRTEDRGRAWTRMDANEHELFVTKAMECAFGKERLEVILVLWPRIVFAKEEQVF